MIALARLSLRRPVLALLAWTALAVALGAVGFGVAHRLSPSILVVPGSESARAEHLANAQFGPSQLTPILLRGPQATLDKPGPALVRGSPRAAAHARALGVGHRALPRQRCGPRPRRRMIVVSIDRSETTVLKTDLPQIERLVHHRIAAPARAHITGQASIDAALKSAMIEKTRRAELLAIPLLFLVLLLLLRAPVAALVVTAFGATTVFAGMGVMTLLARAIDTDPTAVAVGSLAGLALGVGFALMIVERFREERARGTEPHPSGMAAARTVATGGRAVLWGGTAFAMCLILAVLISPTVILQSLGHRRAALRPAEHGRRRGGHARRARHPRPPPGGRQLPGAATRRGRVGAARRAAAAGSRVTRRRSPDSASRRCSPSPSPRSA